MVLVMHMGMVVLCRFMSVFMLVALNQMQEDAAGHERAGNRQSPGDGIAKQGDAQERADERRNGEIGAGARRPDMAQSQDKEDKAQAVTEEAEQRRRRD